MVQSQGVPKIAIAVYSEFVNFEFYIDTTIGYVLDLCLYNGSNNGSIMIRKKVDTMQLIVIKVTIIVKIHLIYRNITGLISRVPHFIKRQ